jgi:hypothetical protein
MDYPEQEEIKKRDDLILELKQRIEHLEQINNVQSNSTSE